MALIKRDSLIGKKPKTLYDSSHMIPIDMPENSYGYIQFGIIFDHYWQNQNEYESALVELLTQEVNDIDIFLPHAPFHYETTLISKRLYELYGKRNILKSYFDVFSSWDGTFDDIVALDEMIENDVVSCVVNNRYKWGNLMRSCLEEFDPLYNVDATEETTRTLEQDGTVSNQKSGTETSKKTGTETNAKSGTETSARTGTEQTVTDEETADRKTGTETSAKTGSEQISYDTEEKTDYDGSEATTHQKAETTTESVTTTESSTFYDTKKTMDVGAANDNVDTLEYSNDRADTLSKTGTETTSFDNRQDQTTYNTTDTITHDNEVTTTHNIQDQLTHNTTDQLTHNTTDQLTHNTTDLESRDLLDTEHILHRRYGNIGITMSTQLLESFRNFANYRIIDVVVADIAEAITEGVY